MDDSLSTVPPVKPRDLPDIFATGTPAAAAMGAGLYLAKKRKAAK